MPKRARRRRRPRSASARFREQLGELIKSTRAAAGQTRAALAGHAGVHAETIRHIEEGRNFEIESLERVVDALQMDFLHLVSRAAGLKMRTELSAEQRRLLDAFRSAAERDRNVIRLLLDLPRPTGDEPVAIDQDPLPFDEAERNDE